MKNNICKIQIPQDRWIYTHTIEKGVEIFRRDKFE